MYDILIHKKAVRSLTNTPEGVLKKFDLILETLKINPVPWKEFDVKKIRDSEDMYKIRIGNYRIIYVFEKENKNIHILRFDT
ncbi:MAG: type II toxin-antitoxin system RelE/ParE family toxin [Theionarchaea archaeon]|nr:type II toxin-antitoxin system RelE/ParE family toxin [Theionarchaea archaeon]